MEIVTLVCCYSCHINSINGNRVFKSIKIAKYLETKDFIIDYKTNYCSTKDCKLKFENKLGYTIEEDEFYSLSDDEIYIKLKLPN